MKRKRKIIGLTLLGLFLAYFSASFIFVPEAPGLKDHDISIVKLESHDASLTHGLLRSAASEHAEDAVKFCADFTISFLESLHSVLQQSRLESLENSQPGRYDIYLSLGELQV